MIKIKKEKNILLTSFLAGLAFALIELIFSIYSHSQSVFIDAVYDASELIFIGLILFLTPLFYKPVSEERPYGYFQVESIFLIIKGFMMLSVTVSSATEIIESTISGGNTVNEMQISIFQLLLGILSVVIYLIMKKMNTSLASPTVNAELLGWKIDIFYSMGMSFAFFAAKFLNNTPLKFISPYFDSIMAVTVIVLTMPENFKMLWEAIKDVFLFSPSEDTTESIKEICTDIMKESDFEPVFFDITKTGRHLWISVYFKISQPSLKISDLKNTSDKVKSVINDNFQNCTCELILIP